MKRTKPLKGKIKYKRKLIKTRRPVPQEQIIPDKSKYDRRKNKKIIERELENAN